MSVNNNISQPVNNSPIVWTDENIRTKGGDFLFKIFKFLVLEENPNYSQIKDNLTAIREFKKSVKICLEKNPDDASVKRLNEEAREEKKVLKAMELVIAFKFWSSVSK
jgi:hypothetical protein